MLEALSCYFSCILNSSTRFILFGLLIGALILGMIFLYSKRPNHMFLSQTISIFAIIEGFRLMTCSMAAGVWIYFGLISGSIVMLGMVQLGFDRHIKELEISDARFMNKMSSDLGCQIYLLDTQKVKAFAHKRRIYLSVGLVELLDPDEIKAVAAHEMYHVTHTPNRFMANSLAMASLWMRSYRDDVNADRFAAKMVGKSNLISAFKKLKISGARKRIKRFAA